MLPISNQVKAICNSSFGPLCLVLYTVIMVYHFVSAHKHTQTSADVDDPRRLQSSPPSIKYSYVLILLGFFGLITLNLVLIDSISTVSFCNAMLLTGPPLYVLFKLFMYLILTARAKEFFSDSTFAYSVTKLRIWMGILVLWSVINAVGCILLSDIVLTDNERPRCSSVISPAFAMSMVLLDAVGGFGSSYLLVKPMMKMAQTKKGKRNNTRSRSASATKDADNGQIEVITMDFSIKFKSIARKQSTLSIISVVTSWFAMILMILTNMLSTFISIDLVVSPVCILLIYKWNQWIFDKLCIRCRKQNEAMENVKNLDVIIQGDTNMSTVNSTSVESENVYANTGGDEMTVSTGYNAAVIH